MYYNTRCVVLFLYFFLDRTFDKKSDFRGSPSRTSVKREPPGELRLFDVEPEPPGELRLFGIEPELLDCNSLQLLL